MTVMARDALPWQMPRDYIAIMFASSGRAFREHVIATSCWMLNLISPHLSMKRRSGFLTECSLLKEPRADNAATPGKHDWALFITTYTTIEASRILEIYALRWGIEVYFEESKRHLGLLMEQTSRVLPLILHRSIWLPYAFAC
ncbi:hypothetical protein [Nitrosomonas communis]|uniref:Transposase DDE domain-containing protein n=1 Tax=Nitrosomonas communis TaxID=44574 RepID=A0A1H3AIV1_9PROT|nr:hypothetical protein [Nitrosomonas communis]SDX29361.1 hypothetical protein SAMN05421882_11452 [Nitrosomonas communis]